MSNLKTSDIAEGDVFSEKTYYRAVGFNANTGMFEFEVVGTKKIVSLSPEYVEKMLITADQYTDTVVVGKEDKKWTQKKIDEAIKKKKFTAENAPKEGDLEQAGIRSIWESVGEDVFTAKYYTKGKELTKKEYAARLEAQALNFTTELEKARKSKKSMTARAAELIKEIAENPVLPTEAPFLRTLRGYKRDFTSLTGDYKVFDLDVKEAHNIRSVNLSTMEELVVRGTRYVLEK